MVDRMSIQLGAQRYETDVLFIITPIVLSSSSSYNPVRNSQNRREPDQLKHL